MHASADLVCHIHMPASDQNEYNATAASYALPEKHPLPRSEIFAESKNAGSRQRKSLPSALVRVVVVVVLVVVSSCSSGISSGISSS